MKKCKPLYGSCNLPAGHKGQHESKEWQDEQKRIKKSNSKKKS